MHKSSTATIIGSLRCLAHPLKRRAGDDVTVSAAIAEAADRMEEMQTREKDLSQKLCCFTGESLEDAADRLREDHNKAKMEADGWKRSATRRMGLANELRKAMGIKENMEGDAELKAALKYVKSMTGTIGKLQDEIVGLRETLEFYATAWMQNQNGSLDGAPSKGLIADKGMKARKALSPTP